MSNNNDPSFQDRRNHASAAKKSLLAKFRTALNPDDPVAIEKRRQREAIVAARSERVAQREAARKEHERELTKQATIAAAAAEEAKRIAAEQATLAAAEQAERDAALKAEQKAARDARYAARKAAKKERRRGY